MIIDVLTLFPEMFESLNHSIIKRAQDDGIVTINVTNIRDFASAPHYKCDDEPYGGGAGMVLAVDVVDRAIKANSTNESYKILMTPQGKTYSQAKALELSKMEEIVIICGHYEGFDERVRDYVDDEISIGDYVLTGGELASMVVADSVIRLLDHAIKQESYEEDSFSMGLLEYPQYTRPLVYDGKEVPAVLVNGNHKLINEYRKKEALRKTLLRRHDLLENYSLSKEEEKILNYFSNMKWPPSIKYDKAICGIIH